MIGGMNNRTNKPYINMAYSLDRGGRRNPYREDRSTFRRGRPPMSGPGQPGMNVVGHGRLPMMPVGNAYAQQPRPGMPPAQSNMMMAPTGGMMPMPQPQVQHTGFNQQQMMPPQMHPQGYYMPPNQPMPQFQPPPYSQVAAAYGQQNFNMPMNQMPVQMQPQNMTEEQKKSFEKFKKERYFQEQQMKLKALSQPGSVATWGPSNVSSLESMMGMFGSGKNKKTTSGPAMNASKTPAPVKQEIAPSAATVLPAPANDDDGFGDFMAGPTPMANANAAVTSLQTTPPAVSTGQTLVPADTKQSLAPSPATKQTPKVEEKQNLESMMLESITDLAGPQKAKKTFKQKTTLSEAHGQSTKLQTTSFTESSKSIQWDMNRENISDLFKISTPQENVTPEAQNVQQPLSVNTSVPNPSTVHGQVTPPTTLPSSGQGSPSTFTPPPWCHNEANLPIVYKHVLEATFRNGKIETELLYPILVLSGLDRPVLGHIWAMCNKTIPGVLTKEEMFMALALIAIAQSGQTQNVTLEALYKLPHPPAPVLTPPGGSTPSTPASAPSSGTVTPATPVAKTPIEAPPVANDDFAPFQEAQPPPTTGLTNTAEPSLARTLPQQQPPPPQSLPPSSSSSSSISSSGFILLPPPPPPPPPAPPQYSFSAAAEAAAAETTEEMATPSPTHSASSIGSAGGIDILDKFSAFHMASDQDTCSNNSIPSGCMYPPMSSEDEYADFKSVDSCSSSSMSSSRASSRTSSSQNTDPEFPGFPRVGQQDVFPDLPTSGSSSPSSIRHPGILGGKSMKLPCESPTFERKWSDTKHATKQKQKVEVKLPAVSGPGLTPSKFGPVRDGEDDEFADFQTAPKPQQFSSIPQPKKISLPIPPSLPASFPAVKPSEGQDEFTDFQAAEPPKQPSSDDLFKFEDDGDKYAALRVLSVDVPEPEDNFADFKKSDDQDEFADFKKSDDQDEFADFKKSDDQDEFADFQNAAEDSFSDFQQNTSITSDQFADFSEPKLPDEPATSVHAITKDDDFSDFQHGATHSATESKLQADYRGGMAGGFFDSDRCEEPVDLEPPKPEKKGKRKFEARRISSHDDEDDLFGRKPPAMTDFDQDDDEFGDFGSAPHVVDDDLFTSISKPKPKQPEKSLSMFGGQKFKGKGSTVQNIRSEKNNGSPTSMKQESDKYEHELFPTITENLDSEEKRDTRGVVKETNESKRVTAAEEDKYSIFRELEKPSVAPPSEEKYSVFREIGQGKPTTPEIEIQGDIEDTKDDFGNLHVSNVTPVQSGNDVENRTRNDIFSGSRYQIGGDDDLFGNLGPNPPGYSPPSNTSQENISDFNSSMASKTPDSISINSKESDSSSPDTGPVKKGLPKLESVASLDLRSFDATPSGDDDDASDSMGYSGSATTDPYTNTVDSLPPKPLDGRSGAMIISTGPPPPLSTGPPLPLFGDRYGGVVGDIEDNERHTYEWQRCLQSCYHTLKQANETFNSVSSSSICAEIIKSEEGSSYLQALVEIYRVSCRVGTAMKASGLETDDLQKLLRDTNLLWNNLAAFLAGSPLMPEDSLFVFTAAVLKSDPCNADKACGVCLLNVDSRSKAFDRHEDSHKLTYGGRQYHAMCANFWVNLVDSILPALPLPSLLL